MRPLLNGDTLARLSRKAIAMPGSLDQTREGAVAFIDVLGFANRAGALPALAARTRFLDPLLKSLLDAEVVINRDFARGANPGRLEFLSFADTGIIFLPRASAGVLSKPAQVVESMVYACAMATATCIWSAVPIRGAIAYGDVLLSYDPVFALGKPVFEAHDLEGRQEWAGVTLCESAAVHIGDSVRAVQWEVPLKGGSERRLAVDWPAHSFGPSLRQGNGTPGPTPDWEASFGSDPKVTAKRENTIAFFTARDAARTFFGAMVGPEQRELASAWESMYRNRPRAG